MLVHTTDQGRLRFNWQLSACWENADWKNGVLVVIAVGPCRSACQGRVLSHCTPALDRQERATDGRAEWGQHGRSRCGREHGGRMTGSHGHHHLPPLLSRGPSHQCRLNKPCMRQHWKQLISRHAIASMHASGHAWKSIRLAAAQPFRTHLPVQRGPACLSSCGPLYVCLKSANPHSAAASGC